MSRMLSLTICTILFKDNLFIFGCAGSLLLHAFSLAVGSGGYSSGAVRGLLTEVAFLVVENRL